MEQHIQDQSISQRFSLILRWIGIASVVGSGTIFMLQGLTAMSSYERFISIAGLTVILAVLGLFVGTRLKETKSARTFLGLAAAATPVVFSQLGAMIYSSMTTSESSPIPLAFQVTAPSLPSIWISLLITGLVLTPILYIGFGSLFRAKASQLALLLVGFSALLLIPIRNPDWTSLLLLTQAIALFLFIRLSRKTSTGTVESLVAVLLPLIPTAIMAIRQMYYSGSYFLLASALIVLAGFFHETLPTLALQNPVIARSRQYGMLFLAGGWMSFIAGILHQFPLVNSIGNLLIFYPPAIGLQLLFPIKQGEKQNWPLKAARLVCIAVPLLSLTQRWNVELSLLHLLIGFLAMSLGYSFRRHLVFSSGLLTASMGMVYLFSTSIDYLYEAPWISLAVLGIALILFAGWLEKNKSKIGKWRVQYQQHFSETDRALEAGPIS